MGTEVRDAVRSGVVVLDLPLDDGAVVAIRDLSERPRTVNEMGPGERIAWLDSLPGDPVTFKAPEDFSLDPERGDLSSSIATFASN